jgi:hypothetical protein
MTSLDAIVLRYVTNHPGTRRRTVVEAIGDRDWDAQKRVRQTLDSLAMRRIIVPSASKPTRYTLASTYN